MTDNGAADRDLGTSTRRSTSPGRPWRGLAVVTAAALIMAACGGGSSKKTASANTTTPVATGDSTTTVAGETTTTVAAIGTTTTTAAAAGSATTAKQATTTTAKKRTALIAPSGAVAQVSRTGGDVAATTSTAPASDVQTGGSLTWLKAGEIPTLDPAGAMANSGVSDGPAGFSIYDMLFYAQAGQIKTHTADSLTSADATVWTLKIHPGIKFSDGTPYDAAAVVFNLKRLQDPANGATRKSQADQIIAMDVIDATTLKLTLKAKNALFPGAFALMPFVGSPTAITKQGKDDFAQHPVGAGPFVLKSWTRDSNMVLQRSPTYWDAPRPYLDQLILRPIVDETARINTFCAGQAEMVYVGAVSNADQTNNRKCGTIVPQSLNGGTDLFFNETKEPMNNAALRKAISMAIDPEDYSKVVTSGLINPARSMFRPDSPFYDASIVQGPFNKAQAQALFTQASQELKQDPVQITATTFPVLNYQNTALYLQSKVNEFQHVKITVVTEAGAAHITNCAQRAYTGICVFGTIFDDPDPTFTGVFQCASVPNYTGYCNTRFDQLVADNEATLDPNQRITDWKEMQKILYADPPVFFMEQRSAWLFTAPGVRDLEIANDGLPMLDRLWIRTR